MTELSNHYHLISVPLIITLKSLPQTRHKIIFDFGGTLAPRNSLKSLCLWGNYMAFLIVGIVNIGCWCYFISICLLLLVVLLFLLLPLLIFLLLLLSLMFFLLLSFHCCCCYYHYHLCCCCCCCFVVIIIITVIFLTIRFCY